MKIKTKKKKYVTPKDFETDERNTEGYRDAVWRQLCNLRHRDLQKECITRGLEFENIVKFDHHKLVVWFYDNYNNSQDPNLLVQYDEWMESELEKRNIAKTDAIRHPVLKMSYIKPILEPEFKPASTKVKVEKTSEEKSAPVKVKDEKWGINSGTKKYLTYQLTVEGLDIKEIISRVKEEYPQAEEKSIKIWSKRASAFKE